MPTVPCIGQVLPRQEGTGEEGQVWVRELVVAENRILLRHRPVGRRFLLDSPDSEGQKPSEKVSGSLPGAPGLVSAAHLLHSPTWAPLLLTTWADHSTSSIRPTVALPSLGLPSVLRGDFGRLRLGQGLAPAG